jgi:peptide deformylase
MDFIDMVMYNPKIISKKNEYETQEGCLSLTGVRDAIRYDEITVEFQDSNFKKQTQVFTGFVAEIIQHECDHLEGIII